MGLRRGGLISAGETLLQFAQQSGPPCELVVINRRLGVFQTAFDVVQHQRLMAWAAKTGITQEIVLIQRRAGDDEVGQWRIGRSDFGGDR
jgi:hypothetical protein